jgi:hypothetical protein
MTKIRNEMKLREEKGKKTQTWNLIKPHLRPNELFIIHSTIASCLSSDRRPSPHSWRGSGSLHPAFKVGVHLNQTIYSDLQDYHNTSPSDPFSTGYLTTIIYGDRKMQMQVYKVR